MRYRLLCLLLVCSCVVMADINLQMMYDFGTVNNNTSNMQAPCVNTNFEMYHPDDWGKTYVWIDFDLSLNKFSSQPKYPKNCPMYVYLDITRCFNFWRNTPAKDLMIQFEYNTGMKMYYMQDNINLGFGIENAFAIGINYQLYTKDKLNRFSLQPLIRFVTDQYNRWFVWETQGLLVRQIGNEVPLQFTFVWDCRDFCTAKGLTFHGFTDVWSQKRPVVSDDLRTVSRQCCVWRCRPQLWYSFGQWFSCPNLCVGTLVDMDYNFHNDGFSCSPAVGLKWDFL